MENPFIKIKADFFYKPPFQPLVFGDYQPPENFPNCCHNHKHLMAEAQRLVNLFPDCCDFHRAMAKNPLVNIANYKTEEFTRSILTRLSYTEHHIKENIEQPNWYKVITDYIEYIFESFGSPSFGDHIYRFSLVSMIEVRQDEIGLYKTQKLVDYINGLYDRPPGVPAAEEIDLNELYHIYQKWLSIFPFTVQPFDKLKDRFTNIFPVISEEPIYNIYTESFKFRVTTKSQLIKWLIEKTKEILKSADSTKLVQEGLISNRKKHHVDLVNEKQKARQNALLNEFSKDEKLYIKTIKKWLSHEIDYFKEITPFFANQPMYNTSTRFNDKAEKQPMSKESEQAITTWKHSLREKFYIATRWRFTHNEEGKRELKATFDLNKVRDEFEHFKAELKIQLMNTQNWKAIELDLQAEFMAGISHYYTWYNGNTEYRDYFGADSPFEIILNVAQSTEREIVKYFPELAYKPTTDINTATSSSLTTDSRINIFNPPMTIDEIEKWFIQLANNKSKNGKPFLTVEQVHQFISRAFLGKSEEPKLRINMAEGERTSITKLFYLYYQRCIQDYAIEPTKQCKEKYVRLLTDNFTNYNYDTVFGTFNNSRNAPKQWNTPI